MYQTMNATETFVRDREETSSPLNRSRNTLPVAHQQCAHVRVVLDAHLLRASGSSRASSVFFILPRVVEVKGTVPVGNTAQRAQLRIAPEAGGPVEL